MSTKCTISHSDDYHLYEECLDNENVWLRLDNIEIYSLDNGGVTVAIPIKVWRAIVGGWANGHWAKTEEKDNAKIEFDLDGLNWIEELKKT